MNETAEAPSVDSPESTASPAETAAGFTPEDVKRTLEETGADARLQAELEASRRARGHISELQKRVTTAEKALARIDTIELSVKSASERLDKIVSSLPDGLLDGQALAALRPQDNETVAQLNARLQELADQLEAVRNPQKAEETIDPVQAQALAQWNAATDTVKKYATSKGIDFADDDPQWGRAYRANPDDPSVAAIELMRHIDGLVEQKARRAERADAASGGADGARTPRVGSVSLEQLKKMSREEIKNLPKEVVDAAMAGA